MFALIDTIDLNDYVRFNATCNWLGVLLIYDGVPSSYFH